MTVGVAHAGVAAGVDIGARRLAREKSWIGDSAPVVAWVEILVTAGAG